VGVTALADAAPAGRVVAAPWRLAQRIGWWLVPALVLAAFGGALVAQRHSLWYDELYTAEVARLPLGDLARAVVRGEGTIPYLRDAPPSYNAPYYAVAHVWLAVTGLAADEVGLRLLSLIAAVGGLAAATCAAARLAGRGVALAFGLIVAANPFVVEYAAEARGYGLALLAAGLLAAAFARWLDDRPSAALVGVAAAGLGLAHWFGLLVVAAVGVAALVLRGPRAGTWRLLAALTAGSLPALALVATVLANGVAGSGAEWIADVGTAVPRLLLRSWSGGSPWLLGLTVVLAGAGLVLGRGRTRMVAACWVAVPVAVVAVAELVRPVYVDRYLLPALLGLALLMAVGVASLRPRAVSLGALALAVVASAAASITAGRLGPKEDVRTAVEVVAAAHVPGQPVVAAARWDALGLDHNARRHHPGLVPDLVLPPATVPSGASTVWVVRRGEGGVKGDEAKLLDLDRDLAGRGLRVVEERRFSGRYESTLVQRWVQSA
jgi:mannosyltransferase